MCSIPKCFAMKLWAIAACLWCSICPAALPAVGIRQKESGELRIIRMSHSGERYTLQFRLELLLRSWNEEPIVPSEGSLTTWIDPDTAPM
jgi:hypothetical protein